VSQSNGFDLLSLDGNQHRQLTRGRRSWSVEDVPAIVASVMRRSIELRDPTKWITHPQAAPCGNGRPCQMSFEQSTGRVKPEYDIRVGPEKKPETLTLNHRVGIDVLRCSESGSYGSSVRMKGEATHCEIVESKWFRICGAKAECDYAKGRSRGKVLRSGHFARPALDGRQSRARGLTHSMRSHRIRRTDSPCKIISRFCVGSR
jgi:hypothetical protein